MVAIVKLCFNQIFTVQIKFQALLLKEVMTVLHLEVLFTLTAIVNLSDNM